MKKSLFLLLSAIILIFSGCGGNNISFYFGTSDTCDGNVRLELNTQNEIEQKKEKIENSKLVFNPNDDGDYENMHLCFMGNNIESVVAESENKTIFYNHYTENSRCLDYFSFYYLPEKDELEQFDDEMQAFEYYSTGKDLEERWNNGEFDDIKNVYFDGLSIHDITETLEIGAANTNLYNKDTLEYTYNHNYALYYLDEKCTKEYALENAPIVYTDISIQRIDGKVVERDAGDEEDLIIQGEAVETNPDVTEDSFIYRYEKLFYNSQQTALEEKGNFDYSDLVGETINITVNFTDESTQKYCLDISFDDNGNIIAELKSAD